LQVILLDEKHEFEASRDDRAKLLSVAPWQIDVPAAGKKHAAGLFADLLPDAVHMRRTQARLEQRIALLRAIEAIRLYAADHGDKLPDKLAEISVPLVDDPFTGKPFVYNVEVSTAILNGQDRRYELTIKK
jgi:hypothetical protein